MHRAHQPGTEHPDRPVKNRGQTKSPGHAPRQNNRFKSVPEDDQDQRQTGYNRQESHFEFWLCRIEPEKFILLEQRRDVIVD
jgi:hypothetical protein